MLFESIFSEFYDAAPYNLIDVSESETVLEICIPGFSRDDINIEVVGNKLKIQGNKKKSDKKYLRLRSHVSESFDKTFFLKQNTSVKSAELKDGILHVTLEICDPERSQAIKIPIL